MSTLTVSGNSATLAAYVSIDSASMGNGTIALADERFSYSGQVIGMDIVKHGSSVVRFIGEFSDYRDINAPTVPFYGEFTVKESPAPMTDAQPWDNVKDPAFGLQVFNVARTALIKDIPLSPKLWGWVTTSV